ncbi:MAG TPA: endolytic transglycosylase MltG [Solirubrobacteraceae bacterium]|jgi:uncharacterized YceG family protein|nr:endolytic transglycosylase MltG [Solirubrobacteraceae bacterium]
MPIFRRHDDAPRERTPEERERARLERQARRAARSGAPLPEPPPPAPDPPTPHRVRDEPPAAEPPLPHLAGEPPAPEPEPPHLVDEPPAPEPPLPHLAGEPPPDDHDLPAERSHISTEPPPAEPHHTAAEPPPPAEPREFAAEERDRGVEAPLAGGEPLVASEAVGDARSVAPDPLQPTAPFDPLSHDTSEDAAVFEPPGERVRRIPARPAAPAPEREPIVPPAARRGRPARPAAAVADPDEKPAGAKPIGARERRLPPPPPAPGTPAFARRRRRRGRILAGLLLLFVVLLALGVNALFQPFKGDGGEAVTVRIPPNSTIADVGDLLAENEIVDSSFLFVLRARLAGADLKAGTYRLRKDSSYGDALDALAEDPAAPRTITVVIPEGRSRAETAPIVRQAGLRGDYLKASDRQKGFRPRRYGARRGTKTLEGFLFPASYELRPGATADQLVRQQLDAFERQVRGVDMSAARRRNLDVYDVLIIASMVEREASLARERPLIAAVVYNRLRKGMPLQLDATIRYATRNWQRPIRQSELESDSPYNTYRRTGLPPTPIGSPGISSIRAAANPANVDYLYYVIKPCGKGAHNFSATDAKFARDKAEYDRKREELGGKSPVEC